MLETFSIRAVELIETAKNLVKINNQTNEDQTVSTFYLLLSMFNANDTICHFLLNELDITQEELYNAYNELTTKESPQKVFSKEFENLVINAANLAKDVNSEYVYDEHLFYVMLEDKDSSATKTLLNLNINIEQLKQDIIDIFNFYEEQIIIVDKVEKKEPNHLINLSKEEPIHYYIPRKDYINQVIYILSKRQKNNPLLIGQAGVGKTALVIALTKIIDKDIYELDLGSLIAGTKYRGEMEEKLNDAIKYVINKDAILFIDEVHNIVGAGSNDGSLDVANIIKPYLSKGKLKLIAATTLDEYYKYIEKDKALTRRFQTIFIDEPSKEETLNILKGIKQNYIDFYHVDISDDLLEYIVNICDNYILNKTFPDKAIDILDESLSRYVHNMKDLKQIVKDVLNSHQGITIPTIDELINHNLYYNEFKVLYLRKLKPVSILKNLGIVYVDKSFSINLFLKDLYKVFGLKKENFLELDLNDYSQTESITNLIGSSKGYVGYSEGGILYNHLLKYPFSVIYIKNYDLSNNYLKIFFNSLFKKDYIIDPHSRYIYLKNTLFLIETTEQLNTIGFLKTNKQTINCDLVVNTKAEESNELFNNLLKKGIIIEGFKNLSITDQINIYYQALLKPIGKYQITSTKTLEFINTN